MVRNVKSNHTASLLFKAHLALLTNYLISMEFVNTLYFPQCLPSILKCQKSLQAHPTPTHGQKDNAAKIKDRLRNDKNVQLVTCGIFYCRDSANMKGCGSLQNSSWLDSDVLRNRQQKHTAVHCSQF